MITIVIYQCQKCGHTMEIKDKEKFPSQKCSKGGRCEWVEPYYFK